jgi:hypothetical protein
MFAERVRVFDLLKLSVEGAALVDVSVGELRNMAKQRNILAHAHFEQNPFSGEYCLINRKEETEQIYSPDRIDNVVKQITKVWMTLRHVEACYDFDSESPPA